MSVDYLIVGAGFTGATLAERLAREAGRKVMLVDRRPHIAGNAYDEGDDHGLLVHRYGPHSFHTNSDNVRDYLSRFTTWRPYEHKVLGKIDGMLVPIPFNLNSIEALFPAAKAKLLTDELVAHYGMGVKVPILKLRQNQSPVLHELAEYIYEKVFLHYSEKQWNMNPEALDPAVTGRVPVHISRDDRYFQDSFQCMPCDGFTALFKKMLDHPNIELCLNTDFADVRSVKAGRIIFTGPIDEYFDYAHGVLPYRSLRFDFQNKPVEVFQPTGTVNYPNDEAYLRVTEMKHLTGQKAADTTLIYDYPQDHIWGQTEPYYPIPGPDSRARIAPYVELEQRHKDKVLFAGRLGKYQYYNMDQACASALALYKILAKA
ncbi:MAG: UDP-galactopyranose mutase [Alphaproteobacteria bacterium]|nr:UDP-galactopyranose mutase [Alphaproteobacteria bacterium]